MSHIDAKEGLSIYRHFCKQTEHVTEYLGVAKKLQNLLNVPIPNLRHVSIISLNFFHTFIRIAGSSISRHCSSRVYR